MSNTFKKWQNREISDIECIRELEQQNRELVEEIKGMFSRSGSDKFDAGYECAISDVLDIFRKHDHASEEGKGKSYNIPAVTK